MKRYLRDDCSKSKAGLLQYKYTQIRGQRANHNGGFVTKNIRLISFLNSNVIKSRVYYWEW